MKKVTTMVAAQAAKDHGYEWGFTWWGIYTSVSTWTHLKYYPITISMRIIISYAMKLGLLFWVCWEVNRNWDNMIRISQWRENHCKTNTSVRRKKEFLKSRTARVLKLICRTVIISITIPRCYKDVYANSFFPHTAQLWNSLPVECFPLTYDQNGFKCRNNRHLMVDSF